MRLLNGAEVAFNYVVSLYFDYFIVCLIRSIKI